MDPSLLRVVLDSDDLCLSFVNTRYWRGTAAPTEALNEAGDVVRWVAAAVPASVPLADLCAARWQADPAAGTLALAAATGLREVMHRALATVADGKGPDLAALNLALRQAAPRSALSCDDGRIGWALELPSEPSAAMLLSPVLWSAADLLAGPRRARLRACANPQCGWLFLDDSKSANRRWCAMSACGNRAKARRHYAKARAEKNAVN
jgi:predicted RNA-binding Zn ribbon-like protein